MRMVASIYESPDVRLYHGEALAMLYGMETASVGAVVTDPPYSSGGFTRADRAQSTGSKYVLSSTQKERPDFHGDNRDQRGFLAWSTMWLTECYRLTKPGGYLMVFIDWRQLPTMTDAIQAAGWIWRGIVPWDKTEASRPQMGFFRQQAEYVLTASKGSMGREQEREVRYCAPGVFRIGRQSEDREHITGKPVALMTELLRVVPAGSTILDPFAGSGSTLLAARRLGLKAIGIELSDIICATARDRLASELNLAA